MTQIIEVVLGFLLTGLLGNRILQQAQHRSWLRQQRLLGEEKEYSALKELSAELSGAIGSRIYQMHRLLWSIISSPLDVVENRLKSYDEALTTWNERLGTYYVRLTIYADYGETIDLERRMQEPLQGVGAELERLVRDRRLGIFPQPGVAVNLQRKLDSLQGNGFALNRDILQILEKKRKHIYFGDQIRFTRVNMTYFSTWQLFQALFVSDVDAHSIVRTSADVR